MNDLKFDIYALAKPKTKADILALLKEALSELQEINFILDDVLETLEKEKFLEDTTFDNAQNMLIKYFKIEVPLSVLKKICLSSPRLLREVLAESETDTYVRDAFIDAVLSFYNLPHWPINAAGDEARRTFLSLLEAKAPTNENGIRVFSK